MSAPVEVQHKRRLQALVAMPASGLREMPAHGLRLRGLAEATGIGLAAVHSVLEELAGEWSYGVASAHLSATAPTDLENRRTNNIRGADL